MENAILFVMAIVALLVVMVTFWLFLSRFRHWLRGFLGGAPVSVLNLIAMRLRGNPPGLLVDTYLALKHRGIHTSIQTVESTYIARKGEVIDRLRLTQLVEDRLRKDGAAN